ncbi:MAG: hypothetical protein ACTHNT_15390 [Actinomycetales bacterium]
MNQERESGVPTPVPSRLRRAFRASSLAAAITVPAVLLAGCGAGQDATIFDVKAPYDGTRATVGDLVINNTVAVMGDAGTQANLLAAIYNEGGPADKLTGITTDAGQVMLSGDLTVPASGGQLELGMPLRQVSDANRASATIEQAQFKAGQTIKLTLHFERAGDVSYYTIVYPATEYYSSAGPSGSPSPSDTSSVTPSPSSSQAPSMSATPSTTLSATPTSNPISTSS